ncbi:MAG TPA: M48 family metalloprotease [Candidatus Saccharimonadales bacterium]|jgi:hypothetical protein|nr:M48 family metalloprotease [Candidatus Saccharimonadales bacterium]
MRPLTRLCTLPLVMSLGMAAWAISDTPKSASGKAAAAQADPRAERIFQQEAALVANLRNYTPMVETYVQRLKPDSEVDTVPDKDRYFLGRLALGDRGAKNTAFKDQNRAKLLTRVLDRMDSFYRINFGPLSFMQMVYIGGFDQNHYDLHYLRQQFLGEVKTLVFDVTPKPGEKDNTRFQGRIWVEDHGYNIVRFNGSYGPNRAFRYFLHFDSWRQNLQPSVWLPAYVYTEESDAEPSDPRKLAMKGQTRLWGYDLKHSGQESEFTAIQVDAADATDHSTRGANEALPVQSQHMWEREAEDNVLDRMERAGILAPEGEVSKVMQTVVNNMEITNNLNIEPEVRCRVLLTTPLESFVVGNTIVLSRGLLDVLPDESSLAMVLARELGHIALGHRMKTKYAFSDRMVFPDEGVFKQINLTQEEKEEAAADQKGLELLQNSPYKEKLGSAGLFLRALGNRSPDLTWLVSPHFGNRLSKASPIRMAALAQAPEIEIKNLAQIPALPLGSRVKLDPWDDHVEMLKSKPVALRSARDKMSFEVTPVFPNLVAINPSPAAATSEAAVKPAQ